MSSPERGNDSPGEEQESDNEGNMEVTFHYVDCLDSEEHMGVTLRRNRDGDIIPGTVAPFVGNEQSTIDRAITAASIATGVERRRPRISPVRPPRPPRPIRTWDELPFTPWMSPIEREMERYAAEIVPRELDDEPDRSTWPNGWDTHHDYFLWTCRGTVSVITDHLQAAFRFDPPIEETFVADRLCGINAYKQMTFLLKYLPGETHSLQRAEARCVVYEADISHPEVRMGTQKLDVTQLDPENPQYLEPILPCWAPHHWSRADDAFAAMYLGEHPVVFQREYGWALDDMPSIEFIRIRMAQIPHLNLTWRELQAAKSRRDLLVHTYPSDYPDRGRNIAPPGFF
ncbi:hypothetical protein BDW62DRAFT_113070 [Aspergillus aurantiobrunneus]